MGRSIPVGEDMSPMTVLSRRAVAVFLLVFGALCQAGGDSAPKWIRYPESQRTYPSPGGRYELYNVDPKGNEQLHALFLRKGAHKPDIRLYSYLRNVSALWSPTGSNLVVNDYGGSDFSNCLIYVLDKGLEPIDIESELRKKMLTERDIFENHHVYIECGRWLESSRVKVKISGYGEIDRRGFTIWLEYKLGDGLKLVSKHRTKTN